MSATIDRPYHATETETEATFDNAVSSLLVNGERLWHSMKQVPGKYLMPKVGAKDTTPRIDRILMPSTGLLRAGWKHGPIGVELKKSDHSEGKLVSQAIDYSNAIWEVGKAEEGAIWPGYYYQLEWIFIYPFDRSKATGKEDGPLGSVMAQNRIGWMEISDRIPFRMGCEQAIAFAFYDSAKVFVKELMMGRKRGSR